MEGSPDDAAFRGMLRTIFMQQDVRRICFSNVEKVAGIGIFASHLSEGIAEDRNAILVILFLHIAHSSLYSDVKHIPS